MEDQPSGHGLKWFLKRFMTLSWSERWQNAGSTMRGLLRSHQIDSPYLVLMGGGVRINKRNGLITTGGVCEINRGCDITVCSQEEQPAHLHIGRGANIGYRTLIYVRQRVEIGAYSMISWDCCISDSDLHQIILADGRRPEKTLPVIIEHDVWVGHHCVILKGVTIGHDSVIAAGSVVSHSMPPHSLVAGNPARRIGEVTGWER